MSSTLKNLILKIVYFLLYENHLQRNSSYNKPCSSIFSQIEIHKSIILIRMLRIDKISDTIPR
jgi:hypothetical protein